MNLVFLLAACVNSLVDGFPFKSMSSLWSLNWPNRVWESWYLIIWLKTTVQSSAISFWTVTFSNWLEEVIWVVGKWCYGPRPQVSRQMSGVGLKWVRRYCLSWTCLSIVMLERTSPAKRFPPKTVYEKEFLSTQSLTFALTKNQSDYSMVL